jgi:hypothetical protein
MPAYYENTFKNISEIPETKKNHVFERFDYYLLLQDNTSNITENFFQGGGQGPGIYGSQSLTSPTPSQNDSAGVPKVAILCEHPIEFTQPNNDKIAETYNNGNLTTFLWSSWTSKYNNTANTNWCLALPVGNHTIYPNTNGNIQWYDNKIKGVIIKPGFKATGYTGSYQGKTSFPLPAGYTNLETTNFNLFVICHEL